MTEDTLSDLEIPRPQQQQHQDQDMVLQKKVPSIECLNSDMPGRCHHHHRKDRGKRMLKTFINRLRLRKCASANISEPDPLFKVAYLGNVVTGWAKGDGCVEKPLATLWRNYTQSSRPDVRMQLLVSGGGLKATTKDHGLTEYWAHRLTTCAAPPHFPRLFCWVYRHEGRRLRHELRCHAVLCQSASIAREIEARLKESLILALAEFRKEKICRQNARLSLANSVYDNPSIPRRKILLSTGACNYRPPLERSKSAPKLSMIEENLEEEMDCEIFEGRSRNKLLLRSSVTEISLVQKELKGDTPNRRFSTIIELDDEEERELRLKFGDQLSIDVQSELILQELADESLMLDTCEMNTWLRNLENANVSDDGSLSSGCESASTVTSDLEQGSTSQSTDSSREEQSQPNVTTHAEPQITSTHITEPTKTELDFKIGESVLSRVRSFERISNGNIRKFCGMKSCLLNNNNNNNNISHNILDCDEVSLIPVGESHADFSSLKVFKKRCLSEADKEVIIIKLDETEDCDASVEDEEEEESGSACSDESGYDEVIDCTTSISNIVLV